MARGLSEAVFASMTRPWAWGTVDCCTAVADALLEVSGVDVMAPLRGYRTKAEAASLLSDGLMVVADRLAREAGMQEVRGRPRGADVGVTAADATPEGRALAICLGGDHWAVKSARGFRLLPAVDRAWRL